MGRFAIVAYKPKPGMDKALLAAVKKHVAVLRPVRLVGDRAPCAMRVSDGIIVEAFEWRSLTQSIRRTPMRPSRLSGASLVRLVTMCRSPVWPRRSTCLPSLIP